MMVNESSCLSKMVIAEQFRDWYASNHGGRAPNMKEISVQVDKKFGACRDGLWVGVQMKPLMQITQMNDSSILLKENIKGKVSSLLKL
jgi:hypothetical protein